MRAELFDLNLLRALDALLTEKNVTRAAERLKVTQQAMSGSLRRLRTELRDDLLVRSGRAFELTPRALAMQLPLRNTLLLAYATLETQPKFDPKTVEFSVSIAMSDYASLIILPKVLKTISENSPGIRCHVEVVSTDSLPRIESGELGVCITPSDWRLFDTYRPSTSIISEKLFEDDFVCVVDAHHPDVGEAISLEQYLSLAHSAVRLGRGVNTIVENSWSAADLIVDIAVTAPSFSSMLFMLPGTRFVATAQRRLAHTLSKTLSLKTIECPLEVGILEEHMLWHARNHADPRHEYVRSIIRAAAADLMRAWPAVNQAKVQSLRS